MMVHLFGITLTDSPWGVAWLVGLTISFTNWVVQNITVILGICGSLRANSLNRMVLTALQRRTPELVIWEGIGRMPLFNPDTEYLAPEVVLEFRRMLQKSRVVVIASPEYAHGVTGVMKNSLDWVVGSGEFMKKPTVVINCSHQATIANTALRETLSVMEAHVLPFSVPLSSHGMTVERLLSDASLAERLDEIVECFGRF